MATVSQHNHSDSEEQQLRSIIDQLRDSLQDLDHCEISRRNEEAKHLIAHYISMTDHIEERRERLFKSAIEMFALSIAATTLLYQFFSGLPIIALWPLRVMFVLEALHSIAAIILYYWQSAYRYPFLNDSKYGNQWRWFYYGNEFVTKLPVNALLQYRNQTTSCCDYLRGFERFARGVLRDDIKQETFENVIQAYLLQVHNYYKNKFYLQLTFIRKLELKIAFILCMIAMLAA